MPGERRRLLSWGIWCTGCGGEAMQAAAPVPAALGAGAVPSNLWTGVFGLRQEEL